MSGYIQLEVCLHEYKLEALSSVLEEQGTSAEKRIQEMVTDLYAKLVPYEVQQEIRFSAASPPTPRPLKYSQRPWAAAPF